jgi:predicted Zn-dependent protease
MSFGLLPPAQVDAGQDFRQRLSSQQERYDDLHDVRAEITFGREISAHLLARFGLYADPELTRYVALVGQSLILYAGRPELEYHFAVLDSDEVNAFAAPGGYVFITRGALALMDDENQLAAVLAHEIGHINEKHIVHELKIRGRQEQGGALLSSLIGGMTDPMRVAFSQMVDMATEILLQRGYKQEDEMAADQQGVIIPGLAGYDPRGMISFLQRLSPGSVATSGRAPTLGTHKANEVRISELEQLLRAAGLQEKPSNNLKERFASHVKF